MEYPNIEYILTYGESENNQLGIFILKKSDISDTNNLNGTLILPSDKIEETLNGHNLEITKSFIKDMYTNKIYSWNDLHIGIEEESIYLVTNSTINKKLWKLPFTLFNYLEIKFSYLFSISVLNNTLSIQYIKFRNTINNVNRVLWTKPLLLANKDLSLLSLYKNISDVSFHIPEHTIDFDNINQEEYVSLLQKVYFKYSVHSFYLQDIQLIRKDNYILLVTRKLHKDGHVMAYIQFTEEDLVDSLLINSS